MKATFDVNKHAHFKPVDHISRISLVCSEVVGFYLNSQLVDEPDVVKFVLVSVACVYEFC